MKIIKLRLWRRRIWYTLIEYLVCSWRGHTDVLDWEGDYYCGHCLRDLSDNEKETDEPAKD